MMDTHSAPAQHFHAALSDGLPYVSGTSCVPQAHCLN
jgi:hypothetical protein